MRWLSTMLGLFCTFLALIGAVGLVEHVAPTRGAWWLNHVLPFGLATQPLWLWAITACSTAAAWLLLRRPGSA
jgi:hypothetical protein